MKKEGKSTAITFDDVPFRYGLADPCVVSVVWSLIALAGNVRASLLIQTKSACSFVPNVIVCCCESKSPKIRNNSTFHHA